MIMVGGDGILKVVILDEVEQFCKDHNYKVIGLETLYGLAIESDDEGLNRAYEVGYGKCNQVVIEAMARNMPDERGGNSCYK